MAIIYRLTYPEVDGDFPYDPNYWNLHIQNGASIKSTSSVTGGSGKSLAFEIVHDEYNGDSFRSEIAGRGSVVGGIPQGTERWWGTVVMIDPTQTGSSTTDTSVLQVLSDYAGYDPQQPNLALHRDKRYGDFVLSLRYDLRENAPDASTIKTRDWRVGRCIPGEFYSIVINMRFINDDTGFVKLWINGSLKVDYSGPTAFSRKNGQGNYLTQYLKFGNYSYDWRPSIPPRPELQGLRTTVFHDYIRLGDENSSYEEITEDIVLNPRPTLPISTVPPTTYFEGPWDIKSLPLFDDFSNQESWVPNLPTPSISRIEPTSDFTEVGSESFRFLTTTEAANIYASVTQNRSFNLSDSKGLWVLWNNRRVVQGTTQGLALYLSHSQGLVSGMGRFVASNRLNPGVFGKSSEWFSISNFTVQDGNPSFNNNFESWRLLVGSATQDSRDYIVDAVLKPIEKPIANIVFTLDDNFSSSYTIGHTEAFSRNIPLTHYIIASTVGGSGRCTAEQLNLMKSRGDYIGVHGANTWAADMVALDSDLEALRVQGIADLSHGAWPNGEIGTGTSPEGTLASAKERGLKSIRKTQGGGNCVFLPTYQEPGCLPAVNLNNNTSLASAKTYVDRAIESGGVLIFYGHTFGASSNATQWVTADWIALLDYVKELKDREMLNTVTIETMYNSLK